MTTYSCKLDLNNAEMMMLTAALEAYIREYDKKNLLQPWNTLYKDLAKTVKKRLQHNAVMVSPVDAGENLETARPNSRPAVSAHMRHNRKKKR